MKTSTWKKILLTGLTVAMVFAGSTSALADGKGKGRGKDRDDHRGSSVKYGKNINIHFHFNDLQSADVEWALRYIASMTSKGVFEGYEDGSFQPNKPIKRIEAIKAAVVAMGLRSQAESYEEMNTKLNFKDAKNVPDWAVGYVAVAVENGLFGESENMVHPNKAADRLWATTLLVKALKKEEEAKANMNVQLPFRDADQIPAGSVGYVAVATQQGLINGYPDNTFRPNKPVTRAEMAKLLDITGDQIDVDNTFYGTIRSVIDNQTLSIERNGQTYQYKLDANATIWRNGERLSAGGLKIGDQVRVHTYLANNTRIIYYVEVITPADQNNSLFTVRGNLVYFGPNGQGKNIVRITKDNGNNQAPALLEYLVSDKFYLITNGIEFKPGSTVELKIKNQLVEQIEIKASAPNVS